MGWDGRGLVSTGWLAGHLGEEDLRIFDVTVHLRPATPGPYAIESGRADYEAGHVPGAWARLVLDEGFDPDVLDANGADLAAGDKGDVGDAALTEHLLCGIDGLGAADPVHHLLGGHFDAAVHVARRDA